MSLPSQKRHREAFKLKVMEELHDEKWKRVKDAARIDILFEVGIQT